VDGNFLVDLLYKDRVARPAGKRKKPRARRGATTTTARPAAIAASACSIW
jgi:hypothetical protein